MPAFRKAVAEWYMTRFGVDLDPDEEVVTLIGSKEGIAHLPWAYVQEWESRSSPLRVIRCTRSPRSSPAEPYILPLKEENAFLPVFEAIPEDVKRKAKICFSITRTTRRRSRRRRALREGGQAGPRQRHLTVTMLLTARDLRRAYGPEHPPVRQREALFDRVPFPLQDHCMGTQNREIRLCGGNHIFGSELKKNKRDFGRVPGDAEKA